MKPSEFESGRSARVDPAPSKETDRSRSSRADPPISDEEARTARVALCPRHRGIVGQRGEHEGDVFYCPAGDQLFRYTKKQPFARRTLVYRWKGYV